MPNSEEEDPNSLWSYVKFDTSIGSFVVELYYRHTPRTCYNMAALAHAGYYDGIEFHRIVRDVIIQGGDPTGTGRGGESIYGGKFEDEITRNLKHTGAGVLSMANSGELKRVIMTPFFPFRIAPTALNHSNYRVRSEHEREPTPWLDNKHTIFGRVYSGMGVVQRMGMVATDKDDRPKNPLTIHKARPYRGIPADDEDDKIVLIEA